MLTKDQANTAADVLLEANKSTPPVRHAQRTLFDIKCRVIGAISGLVTAFIICQLFDVKILMYGVVFIVVGSSLGERIGKWHSKKGA